MRTALFLGRALDPEIAFLTRAVVSDRFGPKGVHVLRGVEDLEVFLSQTREDSSTLGAFGDPFADVPLILVAGGDGTLNLVLSRAMRHDAAIGVLPGGRANDFARALGTSPDPVRACRELMDPSFVRLDVATVNGRPFLTSGGIGLISDVAVRARRWSTGPLGRLARRMGSRCYPLAALGEIAARGGGIDLRDPDGSLRKVGAVVVSNTPRFGGGFSLSPGARPDDGILDLCEVPSPTGLGERIRVVTEAWHSRSAKSRGLRRTRGAQFTLRTASPCVFVGDGEVLVRSTVFQVQVHPGRLRVALPARAARSAA